MFFVFMWTCLNMFFMSFLQNWSTSLGDQNIFYSFMEVRKLLFSFLIQFFMKATHLEQMKEDYSYIMETKERTKEQITQGEEVCRHLMQMFLRSNSYRSYKWYCKIIYLYIDVYLHFYSTLKYMKCGFYIQGIY